MVQDPDKEHSMRFGSSVVQWVSGGIATLILGKADYEIYLAAEAANPGRGWMYAAGSAIFELLGFLYFNNRINNANVQRGSDNYLSGILETEVLNHPPYEGKLGKVNEEGSLAWKIDQTVKNYETARNTPSLIVNTDLLAQSYVALLEKAGVEYGTLEGVLEHFPNSNEVPNLESHAFFAGYDQSEIKFGLKEQVTKYAQGVRGESKPTAEIIGYIDFVHQFSNALAGKENILEAKLADYKKTAERSILHTLMQEN